MLITALSDTPSGKAQARGSDNSNRSLQDAFREIRRMCEGLGLVSAVMHRANEIFKRVSETKSARGKGTQAICAAAIYTACRLEGTPRTFKEICAVCPQARSRHPFHH